MLNLAAKPHICLISVAEAAALCDARTFCTAKRLQRRNNEHNLALRQMRFVVCKKHAGATAPKFFEFFGELAGNAELPIWHDVHADFERFREAIWGFKKNRRFGAFSSC